MGAASSDASTSLTRARDAARHRTITHPRRCCRCPACCLRLGADALGQAVRGRSWPWRLRHAQDRSCWRCSGGLAKRMRQRACDGGRVACWTRDDGASAIFASARGGTQVLPGAAVRGSEEGARTMAMARCTAQQVEKKTEARCKAAVLAARDGLAGRSCGAVGRRPEFIEGAARAALAVGVLARSSAAALCVPAAARTAQQPAGAHAGREARLISLGARRCMRGNAPEAAARPVQSKALLDKGGQPQNTV